MRNPNFTVLLDRKDSKGRKKKAQAPPPDDDDKLQLPVRPTSPSSFSTVAFPSSSFCTSTAICLFLVFVNFCFLLLLFCFLFLQKSQKNRTGSSISVISTPARFVYSNEPGQKKKKNLAFKKKKRK